MAQNKCKQCKSNECKSNQASIYENSGKDVVVAKGKVAQTLYHYGPEFYVEVKVKITEHPKAEWYNILQVTKGHDIGAHGDRIPLIGLHKTNFFHLCTTANGKVNNCKNFHGVKLHEDYHIIISQQYNTKKELIYTIVINDKVFHSVRNTKPASISPALLYLSAPWAESINDIGEVSDVIVIPGTFLGSQSIFQKCILICSGHVHVNPKPVLEQSKVVNQFENFGKEFTVDFKFTLKKHFPLEWMNVLSLSKGNF